MRKLLPDVLRRDNRLSSFAEIESGFSKSLLEKTKYLHVLTLQSLSDEELSDLAWQFHVEEVYEFAKDRKEKIAFIKQAIHLHRLKGTPAGLKKATQIAGSKILKLLEPPQKLFLSPALSKEEKNYWLRQLPQLRIYPQRKRAKKQGTIFWKDYIQKTYPLKTDAMTRMMARVVLYKNGSMQDLYSTFFVTEKLTKNAVVDIFIPGRAGFASFLNKSMPYVAQTDASNRAVSIKEITPYIEEKRSLSLTTLTINYRPIHIDAEWIAEQSLQRSMFLNSAKNFFPAVTDTVDRLYWKLYLYDPSTSFIRNISPNHLNYSLLGMPPHTCEILIDATRKSKYQTSFLKGYTLTTDKTYLERIFKLLHEYKRESVKVLIDTRRFRKIKASSVLKASTKNTAGMYKEVA